ncbi:MAG: ferrous iron transport protein B [Rikenellaceae bacterium]|nr:ferrous iron transport protein B [Rikenellaceae bacterium]
MRLSDLKTGQSAVILKVLGHGGFRRRIMEMGFVRGKRVEVLQNAPLKDPIKYKVMEYEVSLRRSEAQMIEVITEEEAQDMALQAESIRGTSAAEAMERAVDRSRKRINVALVGNPNSGKTSLFNIASGSHEHVGNYSGVTVGAKLGHMRYKGYEFNIYDLPGTYALSAYTPEEVYVRRQLFEHTPDVVVNVVTASNLERNLYLTTELIDINLRMVVALNMYDELQNDKAELDYRLLGELLGVPMVPTVSKTGKGIDELFDTVIALYEDNGQDTLSHHIHINHGACIEESVGRLAAGMKKDSSLANYHTRYLALKMLERDREVERLLSSRAGYAEWVGLRDREVERIEKELGEDIETAIANEKYGFIAGALKETYTPGTHEKEKTTNIIDTIVTHKVWGYPIFFFIMWVMFEATFVLGAYPMEWIEHGVGALGAWLGRIMADGPLKDLVVDGIIGGVGGVIVFLPNILILYLFISLMEDSGYMARAAFIMDKIMHKIGLHGKSFIPLVMGFGCNVPAIMATRTIESRSSRLITILINPFMSCSARLPVFVLLAGVFFPAHAGTVLFCLYLLGIVVAVITAKLLRRFLFRRDDTPFVMELPPYRVPTSRSVLRHMWERVAMYLRKMGGLILVASVCVWFLSYFPRHDDPVIQQEDSYIGRVGRFTEPLVEPLGLNWKASVALLTGAVAKEVTVSTLGVLYAGTDDDGDTAVLSQRLTEVNPQTGVSDFNKANALSFLVFVLLYFPCLASLVAIKQEAGGWKWAAFSFVYNTVVAWIIAFVVYHIAVLLI